MTALDVASVKSRPLGQGRGKGQLFRQPVQIRIADDAGGIDGRVSLKEGIVVGDQRGGHALRLAVAAGMGQLNDDGWLVSVFPQASFLDLLHQRSKIHKVVFIHVQLTGIGSTFFHDGGSLKPDDSRATPGKAEIAAACQRVGQSARRAVASLHSLIGDAVGDHAALHGDGRFQNGCILRVRKGYVCLAAQGIPSFFCVGNGYGHDELLSVKRPYIRHYIMKKTKLQCCSGISSDR